MLGKRRRILKIQNFARQRPKVSGGAAEFLVQPVHDPLAQRLKGGNLEHFHLSLIWMFPCEAATGLLVVGLMGDEQAWR